MSELTKRERAVVALIANGARCAEIARELQISVHTVRKHRANICRKGGLHSASQLLSYAIQANEPETSSSARHDAQPVPAGIDHRRLAALTERERQVLWLVAAGRTSKEIARDLAISPATVRKHRQNLAERLGLRGAARLARLAFALWSR